MPNSEDHRVHPDSLRLVALIKEHDDGEGNAPDRNGKTSGFDRTALLGAAAHRGNLLYENFGPLRKTLTTKQADEVLRLLAAAWLDGFAVGGRAQWMPTAEQTVESRVSYFIQSRPAPSQPWQQPGLKFSTASVDQALGRLAARREMQSNWEHRLMQRKTTVSEEPYPS
ncbi:hypothetical protein ACFV3N_16660 [Streptomyces bauhiniae]|uniref:hypothetical protein n=1 Tax=Streptomyces bauhiniae TaxID=2340725 RepID=UPI00365777B0